MKQGTLEKIQNLAVSLQLVTVEDMQKHSLPQLVTMIANKLNELMNEVHRFETDVIEMVETQNENIQYLLGEGLHLEVATVFERWMEDGTFDTLINQTALKKVNDRIDETNAQLFQISNKVNWVDPDSFSGTDAEKMQKAFDYAINNDFIIIGLNRKYDITGASIKINKGENPRKPIYIKGIGGACIVKNDAGFIFDSEYNDVGDFYVDSVRFMSTNGNDTKVYNASRIIRIHSNNNFYSNIDYVFYNDDTKRYIQSIRAIGDSYIYISKSVFYFNYCWDLVVDNVTCERSNNFLTDIKNNNLSNGITIINSVIEGLSGHVCSIEGGATFNLENNYFELNDKYLIFDGACFRAVKINGNFFYDKRNEVNRSILEMRTIRTPYFTFDNNHVDVGSSHTVFNVTGSIPLGVMISTKSYISPDAILTNKVNSVVDFSTKTYALDDSTTVRQSGGVKLITVKIPYSELSPNEKITKQVPLPPSITYKADISMNVVFVTDSSSTSYQPTLKSTFMYNNNPYIFISNETQNTVGFTTYVDFLMVNNSSAF